MKSCQFPYFDGKRLTSGVHTINRPGKEKLVRLSPPGGLATLYCINHS